MINAKNVFDQQIKNNLRTYDIRTYRKIPTGQGDDYTTGCLLDYNYFKDHFKMIAIDFIKKHLI